MIINNERPFQKPRFNGLYDVTRTVQENTLLNRGIIDIGGCAIPQALMSNNKDEGIERFTMSAIYFCMSILTPFFMLPLLNRHGLYSNGLVKNFKNAEKEIMQVSKKYLTEDGKYLAEGIKKTGLRLDAEKNVKKAKKQGIKLNLYEEMEKLQKDGIKLEHQKAFDDILERYKGKEDELREKLIKTHAQVFKNDFLTTAWMWCATPYITTTITEKRTHKKGFSAAFDMVNQDKFDEKKYKADKKKKLLTSALIATIPPLIAPKMIIKSITNNGVLKKFASAFNYSNGMFMSKTIFALMWALCDYPSQLVGSRDNYELRDRTLRGAALFGMFFGGDFALNNIVGRAMDKFAGTQIMDRKPIPEKTNKFKQFIEDFKLSPKNFADLDGIHDSAQGISKNKKYGAALYWFALLSNCALIGLAMPAIMNRMLRKSVHKDNQSQIDSNALTGQARNDGSITFDKRGFKEFGF